MTNYLIINSERIRKTKKICKYSIGVITTFLIFIFDQTSDVWQTNKI